MGSGFRRRLLAAQRRALVAPAVSDPPGTGGKCAVRALWTLEGYRTSDEALDDCCEPEPLLGTVFAGGWHSKNEPPSGERGEAKLLVSVSFGTRARIKWKGKSCPDSDAGSCWLDHGDLLVFVVLCGYQNVGGWLTQGDLALDVEVDYLAVVEHRLIPARVRHEWAMLKAMGIVSFWSTPGKFETKSL